MKLSEARQVALVNGVVDVIQAAQREVSFQEIADIQATAKMILEFLISDWS
jgi:hypothetical protein